MAFIEEFQRSAKLPKAVSASFLALIPKKKCPQGLEEYRPISLIGCLYKILAKVLAGRVKRVLKNVVSECQNAFLAGRNILDGVVVVNEILDMAKREKKKCVVLKADFAKAYDSVSWSYIDYMLERMGFGEKWRKWMWGCMSATSISVLVNGSPTGEFVAQKGLKQGDPLSPFLFLIAAEGLAGLVRKGSEANNFSGFKVSNNLSVSLLQFADDTIFFCDGKDRSIWCLKAILRSFELVSGLKVNFSKSNIIGVNIQDEVIVGISNFLACKVGSLPFKFLGIPVGASPRRVSTWQSVIDNMKARLNVWRSKQLSMGGRVTLINSVLSSLPLYLFSFYKAPKKVLGEMIKLQRRFLWGGDEEHRKMAWVKWDVVCLPKDKGGLGVKNLEAFNLALLSKWRWRCLVEGEDCLWRKILIHRYGEMKGWDGAEGNGRVWRRSSLWWRDLKVLGAGTDLQKEWFNGLIKKKLGDGSTINFWSDVWLGTESFERLFPALFNSIEQKDAKIVAMGKWETSAWVWNLPTGVNWPAEAVVDAEELAGLLRGVSPVRDSSDIWRWLLDNVRGFSVKNCYAWLGSFFAGDDGTMEDILATACKRIWRNDVPSKILIFTWRMLRNRLPTRDALARRGVLNSSHDLRCVLCSHDAESVDHLFLTCNVARDAWRMVLIWFGVRWAPSIGMVESFVQFGKILKGKERRRVKHLIWMAFTWILWRTRNNVIFRGDTVSVTAIVQGVKIISWGWFKARSGRRSTLSWADWEKSPMECFLSL